MPWNGRRELMPRRFRGFTLIELLVVIAIIAIVAAILFPVFSRTREKSRQATCSSNLKEIGLAAMLYAADYDILIRNARLMDGSGNPWQRADLAVKEAVRREPVRHNSLGSFGERLTLPGEAPESWQRAREAESLALLGGRRSGLASRRDYDDAELEDNNRIASGERPEAGHELTGGGGEFFDLGRQSHIRMRRRRDRGLLLELFQRSFAGALRELAPGVVLREHRGRVRRRDGRVCDEIALVPGWDPGEGVPCPAARVGPRMSSALVGGHLSQVVLGSLGTFNSCPPNIDRRRAGLSRTL